MQKLQESCEEATQKLTKSYQKATRKLQDNYQKATRKVRRKLSETYYKATRKLQENYRRGKGLRTPAHPTQQKNKDHSLNDVLVWSWCAKLPSVAPPVGLCGEDVGKMEAVFPSLSSVE